MTSQIKEQNELENSENASVDFNTDATAKEYQQETASASEIESEEQLLEKGRIARIQLETEGKRYFKPMEESWYKLKFNRAPAMNVRGKPSAKLTRKIPDRNDPNKIIGEVPVLEWIYEIEHISGNSQTWSITSRNLATKLLDEWMKGKSIIDFRKRRIGAAQTQVEYDVVGVS